jgi:hypothetical protein
MRERNDVLRDAGDAGVDYGRDSRFPGITMHLKPRFRDIPSISH